MLNKVEINYFKNYLMRNLIKSVIVKEYKITKVQHHHQKTKR